MPNYGYISEKIDPEHYVLGGFSKLPKIVLQPDGQWDNFLPQDEIQNLNGIEPMACTTFGTLNCIEVLHKRLYGEEVNYSDRYLAICSGTVNSGNSPQRIAETIRNASGLLREAILPFDKSITDFKKFYTPAPMDSLILQKGRAWLDQYLFGHEWVPREQMKEALQYSPLGVSVYAWVQDNQGLYIKPCPDNHWCMVYGYVEGEYWKCFDSYDNTHKRLAWDYNFGAIKRYHLEKLAVPPKKNWLDYLKFLISHL